MSEEYKYPPDTSWIPAGWIARGGGWGVGSIALSLVPFVLWAIASTHGDLERGIMLALACWFIGLLVGLRGLRTRGTSAACLGRHHDERLHPAHRLDAGAADRGLHDVTGVFLIERRDAFDGGGSGRNR